MTPRNAGVALERSADARVRAAGAAPTSGSSGSSNGTTSGNSGSGAPATLGVSMLATVAGVFAAVAIFA